MPASCARPRQNVLCSAFLQNAIFLHFGSAATCRSAACEPKNRGCAATGACRNTALQRSDVHFLRCAERGLLSAAEGEPLRFVKPDRAHVVREHPEQDLCVSGSFYVRENALHHPAAAAAAPVFRQRMDAPQLGSARHTLFARGVPPCDAVGLAVQLQNIAVSLLLGEKPRVHFLGALDARTLGKELRRDDARERRLPAFGLDVRETRLVSALRPPDMDRKIVLYHLFTFFASRSEPRAAPGRCWSTPRQ